MQLSIFEKIKAHPVGAEEKDKEAKKSRYSKTVTIVDENDLINFVTTYAWSPSVFSNNKRSNDNFISTDFMVLDIDKGLRIEAAEKRCENLGLCHLILPSPSFTEELHKFRIIFPVVETIVSKDVFDSTWNYLCELFPECDVQCKDYARFYFGSKLNEGVYGEGNLLVPVKLTNLNDIYEQELSMNVVVKDYSDLEPLKIIYGDVPEKVPKRVDDFFKNAYTGIEGEWITTLNACVFSLGLQGIEEDRVWQAIEKAAPYELDRRDEYAIRRAYYDGKNARQV